MLKLSIIMDYYFFPEKFSLKERKLITQQIKSSQLDFDLYNSLRFLAEELDLSLNEINQVLKPSKQRLNTILSLKRTVNFDDEAIFISSPYQGVISINSTFCEMLNFPSEEPVLSMNFDEIDQFYKYPDQRKKLSSYMTNHSIFVDEKLDLIAANGDEVKVKMNSISIPTNDGYKIHLGAFQHINAKREGVIMAQIRQLNQRGKEAIYEEIDFYDKYSQEFYMIENRIRNLCY